MTSAKMIERLKALQGAGKPFVSLYLNTEAARELGVEELALRWRSLRDQISGEVPEKALLLLEEVVEGSHRKGHGLAAFTFGEEMHLRRFLASPITDSIASGPLPSMIPLIEWIQDHPTYAVVVADRQGADIHVVGGMDEDETIEVEGDHDEIRKSNPGGWSQRRFQNRAEDSWEQNAEKVAKELDLIVRQEALPLVIVMGDVRAVAYLKENASPEVAGLIQILDTAPPTDDALDEVREEVEQTVAALTGRSTEAILSKFLEERGQSDLATDGLEATLAALRIAQVETLLVARDGVEGSAWFSRSDVTQAAAERSTLSDIGMDDLEEAPASDVLVRLALGTGAAIRVIPTLPQEHGPTGGVGAILRFTTEGVDAG
jgi:peptide subunit release factor 1 (eRF1)